MSDQPNLLDALREAEDEARARLQRIHKEIERLIGASDECARHLSNLVDLRMAAEKKAGAETPA